jgi:hypothetical protein
MKKMTLILAGALAVTQLAIAEPNFAAFSDAFTIDSLYHGKRTHAVAAGISDRGHTKTTSNNKARRDHRSRLQRLIARG